MNRGIEMIDEQYDWIYRYANTISGFLIYMNVVHDVKFTLVDDMPVLLIFIPESKNSMREEIEIVMERARAEFPSPVEWGYVIQEVP
jgi:hypothetical protein